MKSNILLRKTLIITIGVIILLFASFSAKADHATAGNITYKCVGKDSFEVTLTFYRDCNANIDLPSTASIKVQSGSTLLKTLTVNLQSKTDVTPICDTSLSRCAKSTSSVPFGFKKFIYKGIVELAYGNSQYCDIKFSYTLCCRGWVNPNADFYVESNMNRCKSKCNSSPVFEYDPIFVVTTGQDVRMYQSATDEDGDSLVYLLTQPSAGPVSNLTFPSGVTYLKPFGQFVPFNYDTASGLVSFKPSNTGSGLVAYKVEEWGKDSSGKAFKKGEIIRDALTTVQNGSNKAPVISGIDGSKADEITICANVNSCFSITSYDLNTSDIVELNWDNSIPGAVFSSGKGRNAKATFCWKPGINQLRTVPYVFTATAKDNICPVPAITQKKFKVYVKSTFPQFSYIKKQLSCAYYQFQIQSNKSDSIRSNWTINSDTLSTDSVFIYRFSNNGTYILRNILTAPGAECNPFIIDTFIITNLPTVSAGSPATICYGDSTQLSGSGGIKYKWSPSTSLSDANIANPVTSPKATTTYTLTAEDGNGCQMTSSVKITVLKPDLVVSSDTSVCKGSTIQLKASGGVFYSWTPATGLSNSNIAKPYANPKVTTTYYVTVEDTTGCKLTDSIKVTVYIPKITVSPDVTICMGDSSQISASGGVSYAWSPSIGLSNPNIANPFAFPKQTTTYSVIVTDSNGCQVTEKITVNVNKALITVSAPSFICSGDSVQISATGGVSYKWLPEAGLNDPTISNPIAKPLVTTNYVVFVKDTNGCTASDSVLVNVDNNCVWPGDANKDGNVNASDILPLGVGFGTNGFKRLNASLNYQAQFSKEWNDSFANGINYKHADCNGDGIINKQDTIALVLNYSPSPTLIGTNPTGNTNDPSIKIKFIKDSVQIKDTVIASINYGNTDVQAKNTYGLAFSLNFDTTLVKDGKLNFDFNNSWLFNDTNKIYIRKDFTSAGKIEVAITRTDRKALNGSGQIGTLQFIIPDSVGGLRGRMKVLPVYLEEVKIIDAQLNNLPFNVENDSLIIYNKVTSINNKSSLTKNIHFYPNPAREILTIETIDIKIKQLRLINVLGQVVLQQNKGINAEKNILHINELESGLYFITIISDEGTITKPVIIER